MGARAMQPLLDIRVVKIEQGPLPPIQAVQAVDAPRLRQQGVQQTELQPPGRFTGARSNKRTRCPARAKKIAAAGPAVPAPTIATSREEQAI